MRNSSTAWPALGHRFRLAETSSFSVLCIGSCCATAATASATDEASSSSADDGSFRENGAVNVDRRGSSMQMACAVTEVNDCGARVVCIDVVCGYTRYLVAEGFARRRKQWRVTTDSAEATLHWGDYEMINWERVVSGDLRASSFCVRKGLSRKAQLSRYCNKYASKRRKTPLEASLPRTLVIDTWEAFDDDMTFNLGGDIAAFGSDLGVRQSVSLSTRIDWCLGDAKEWVEQEIGAEEVEEEETLLEGDSGAGLDAVRGPKPSEMAGATVVVNEVNVRNAGSMEGGGGVGGGGGQQESARGRGEIPNQRRRRQRGKRRWILKPSTLNKGVGLALGNDFETLRDAIHSSPDIREWVLQEYVERPLLADGRKFHIRAYALAVGCLQVYLLNTALLLRAAKKYPQNGNGALGDDDPLAHVTNTARQAEDASFREEDNVWLLDDMVGELERQGLNAEDAARRVEGIVADMRGLTAELFRAFRGEFAVFSPLPGCFEHFGLDFMVDEDFHVWLLEANPGPDFKQTGSRLKHVIGDMIEGTMRICVDDDATDGGNSNSRVGGDGGVRGQNEATMASTTTRIAGVAEGGTGFCLVLDEQWRGTSAAPSMKMT